MDNDPAVRNLMIVVGLLLGAGAMLMKHQQMQTPPEDDWFRVRVVEQPGVVVVKFGAEWCPPCRAMHATLNELRHRKGSQLKIVEIDIDKKPHLAQHYGIRSIPRTMIFVDGQYKTGTGGSMPVQELERLVAPYIENRFAAAQ